MGFGQGLSGLRAQAQKLDVIGNNIANSSTVGFKSSSISFSDVYASSRVGLGTSVAAVNQNFGVGIVSNTGGQFDIAIDGAAGFFRMQDASGSVFFTRNGEFGPNKEGYLTNNQGQFLTGFIKDAETGLYGLNPEPIRIPTGNIAARATGAISGPDAGVMARRMNLDADAIVPTVTPLDPLNPDSYNTSVPMTVYDSLGREHQLTQYFVKTGDNAWDVHYQLNSDTSAIVTRSITFTTGGEIATGASGLSIAFDPAQRTDPLDPASPLAFPTLAGADALSIPLNYSIATQFGGGHNLEFQQDGYGTGEYTSMSISQDGTIVANYTNGEMAEVGYIVLANFANLQGLQPVGGNAWAQTAASGEAILGRPGQNGMSMVKGQALEESNVDMGTELVNMIISQRAYQANAQTITTQSEILQTLINIR
ncbi:flagellar hook protein FlgE [Achromobacter sp. F4_2707]|uniref:flagellar hook protein FlgE n=1 Tax=Achromobacter sp. F4_2707 TaxID=3114286 RepID=UPI0039C5FCFA